MLRKKIIHKILRVIIRRLPLFAEAVAASIVASLILSQVEQSCIQLPNALVVECKAAETDSSLRTI